MKIKTLLIISCILLSIILLIAGIRVAGFIHETYTYKILCLGESTTAGRYPQNLEQELNSRNIGKKFSVIHEGIGGTCTDFILAKLEENLDTYKPDMVITMMGINDNKDNIIYEYGKGSKISKSSKAHKLIEFLKLYISHELNEIKKTQGEATGNNTAKPNGGKETDYVEQGDSYRNLNKYEDAKKMYMKAIEINPGYDIAYSRLGQCYMTERKYEEAQKMYKKAIEINPKEIANYMVLGVYYWDKTNHKEAETMFRKIIEIDRANDPAYSWLYNCYSMERNYEETLKILNQVANLKKRSNGEISEPIVIKDRGSLVTRKPVYGFNTVNNYKQLRKILNNKEIKYVAVQYPTKKVQVLESIFDSAKDIVYVDNEKTFNDAVSKEGYDAYFTDRFAWDFGHFTEKANKLLAKNIADAIMKSRISGIPQGGRNK